MVGAYAQQHNAVPSRVWRRTLHTLAECSESAALEVPKRALSEHSTLGGYSGSPERRPRSQSRASTKESLP